MEEFRNNFEATEYVLRQSWETHRQAFGPILEPAFEENHQVRIPHSRRRNNGRTYEKIIE